MPSDLDLLHVVREIRRSVALATLQDVARRAGWSRFHLHRAFRRMARETPKRFALRLRLERAAARLASTDDAVLDVALATGFASHEVFTRAFRRHFGQVPSHYRAVALVDVPPDVRVRHRALVDATGPCIRLFHLPVSSSHRTISMPTLTIARQDLEPQPALFVRMRVARQELAAAIAEGLGKTFPYAMRVGLPIAGRPFTRYLSTGPGLFVIEVGVPMAASAPGTGAIEAGVLPGGPVAVGVHGGPYDQLSETYAALERWIEANGYRTAGPPWESYVNDPADFPDPADWRTEVYWPIEKP